MACTLAITSQANAANYDTWTYIDNPVTALDWDHMDKAGTVDGNYVNYSGFVYYNNTNGDFDQSFNGDTVNGTISTYYLNHDYADSTANQLDISNSVIHGSITSMLPGGYYDRFDADGNNLGGYDFYTDAVVDTHWRDGDVFTLNIANTTIDDDYEALYFTDSYKDGDVTKHTNETFDTSEGVAVNLDVESNINISNNSRVAGIALSQGNTYNETYTTESHTWDNNISVKDSTVTSGSNYILDSNTYGKTGHFARSPPVTSVGIKLPPGKPEEKEKVLKTKCNNIMPTIQRICVSGCIACDNKNCSPPPVISDTIPYRCSQ